MVSLNCYVACAWWRHSFCSNTWMRKTVYNMLQYLSNLWNMFVNYFKVGKMSSTFFTKCSRFGIWQNWKCIFASREQRWQMLRRESRWAWKSWSLFAHLGLDGCVCELLRTAASVSKWSKLCTNSITQSANGIPSPGKKEHTLIWHSPKTAAGDSAS